MSRLIRSHLSLLLVGMSAMTGACSGDSGGGTTPTLVVTAIVVEPGSASPIVGDTVRLTATVKDQNGAAMAGKAVAWSSAATNVATVAATGTVTAVSVGTATITATADGRTGTADVTVRPVPLVVTTIEVTPPARTVGVGDTLRLTATVKDQNGAAMAAKTVTWSSGAPAVATVSASGLATAVGPGSATVTATSDGKLGSATLTVRAPVASLAISVDTATLAVGATLTLQATLRDAQGAVLSGRTIAWTSLDPTVASVSSSGVVTAVQLGAARIVGAAEGKSDTARVRVPAPPVVITLDASAARTVTIGQGGGSIETLSAAGIRSRLDVPAGALMSPVAITMTPTASIANLPLSGGLVAGIQFAPSGLVFAMPATLTIETTRQPAQGQRVIGLTYQTATVAPSLNFATRNGTAITIPVRHFSTFSVGFGSVSDLLNVVNAAPAGATESFYTSAIIAAAVATPPDATAALRALEGWFDTVVLPALNDASTDLQLATALSSWRYWNPVVGVLQANLGILIPGGVNAPSLVSRRDQWLSAFGPKVRAAMDGNKQLCDQPNLAATRMLHLDNAFFWVAQSHIELTQRGTHLRQSDFLQLLCAQVSPPSVSLVNPVTAGFVETLDATWGVTLTGATAVAPGNFEVQAAAAGGTLDRLGGLTALSPQGFYTTQLTPSSGSGTTTVTLSACYSSPLILATPSLKNFLCRTQPVTRTRLPDRAVYTNDFSGTAGSEWSLSSITTSPSGQRFLGEIGNGSTTLSLTALPAHSSVTLEFDIYIIDSWNGNGGQGSAAAPDIIDISVVGGQTLKRTTFSNKPSDAQAFPGDHPGNSNPAGTGAIAKTTLGYPISSSHFGDSSYRLRLTFTHLSSNIAITFASQQTSGQNERWGLDNVRVVVNP